MSLTRQFNDYRETIADELETAVSGLSVEDEYSDSTEKATERLLAGDITAFTNYLVMFGDKDVEVPTSYPLGYAKSYIDWELLVVSKSDDNDIQLALDNMYQTLHQSKLQVEGTDKALTLLVQGWSPVEYLTHELRMASFNIRIITLDTLI